MQTYLASSNPGKIRELRELLVRTPLDLQEYAGYDSPVEDATDYRGNARIKAHALARQLQARGISAAALADDSGLEVDALDGRPGIFSARYGGPDADWNRRRELLLEELHGVPGARRGARFVCALALVFPDGETIEVQGEVRGRIAEGVRGTEGFGYDPVFFYPPRQCTFAELTPREKNAVSHRRAAVDALAIEVRRHG